MASVHEGVSCDACMKNNFAGRRYKCLICYDFDLCSGCYEAGASNTQHLNTHPMQCILTRSDYDLYYNGDTQLEPQAFTCPYCGKFGFTEFTLSEHVSVDHEDDSYEVVCPICAAIPTGDPNHLTEDLANHLNLEHRNNRDNPNAQLTGIIDDSTIRFSRRLNARNTASRRGSGRNTFQFGASSTLSSLVSREGMDPIAELLSQLSGVRRAAASAQNTSLHLQHLQAQLTREREHLQQTRQNLFGKTQITNKPSSSSTATITNGLIGNGGTSSSTSSSLSTTNGGTTAVTTANGTYANIAATNTLMNQILELPNIFQTNNTVRDNRFLLSKYDNNSVLDNQQQQKEPNKINNINQSFFIHDIILATLMKQLELNEDNEES